MEKDPFRRNSNNESKGSIGQQQTSSDFVLQWGNRKRLRCMKVHAKPDSSSARFDRGLANNNNRNKEPARAAAVIAIANQNGNGYFNLRHRPSSPSPAVPHRVLRNSENSSAMRAQNNGGGVRGHVTSPDKERRAATNHHHSHRNSSNHHESGNNNNKSGQSPETTHDSKKGGGSSSGGSGEAPQPPVVWPPKFVIALTNKEKEEDFFAFKGCKLPHRPKKRAKYIQRTLNLVMPGGWLCDLTLERYEVREKKTSKKRPRGLKAMGNMDSDSE